MTTEPPSVLDQGTAEYVLPAPPRATGEVVVVAPRADQNSVWRRGSDVARTLGDRFLALVETQQIFAAELRERLLGLDQSIAEAPRAQWKGAVRDLLGVLDWGDAVHADLLQEARLAATGAEPIAVEDLCQEVAAHVQTATQPVFVRGQTSRAWWGAAPALAELVRQALGLVGERTSGIGARSVEISEAQGCVAIAISGVGEPADAVEADSVARFRRAVEQIGAVVRPDGMGPGGAGLRLELPFAGAAG